MMVYKVPLKFFASIETYNPQLVSDLSEQAMDEHQVGKVMVVKYRGRYSISTFYYQSNRRDAEFEAAANGFPFFATMFDRPIQVGLLARLYRAIIA